MPHSIPKELDAALVARLDSLGVHVERFSDQDAIVVRRQMGHRPRMALGVLRRCRYGYPQVLLFAPLEVDEAKRRISPNSTLCWLSCPLLVREIDRLERDGELDRFEHLADVDPQLQESLGQAHRATASIRRTLVPEEWAELLQAERPRDWWILTETGISGITRPAHVKCLHAHLADELARGANPVGQEVARLLESQRVPVAGTETCWRHCTPEGASQHLSRP
ncbi:DUF501 domain-containing protein [Carboxydochorda subterranea]|uniref:DUF501 domain-containing protein n=1 Tax=Carboxydichorda subterranea TaxID=3109565 RepID=A0ABZ1BYK3_9FIRM|nr:DUF501 domain-containing protein [Limnochorda sp. L945t]WRP17774.1 DUF501 domain-containing protein [Limnochorda sp. L945t]